MMKDMKSAIILHGMPEEEDYRDPDADSQSNSHWLPWIQQQLIAQGVLAQTPELPEPYAPDYQNWKAVFEQFEIGPETMLIGHSAGAGFLARWLSEHDQPVGKVVLVAPWLDPHHEQGDNFTFELDAAVPGRTQGVTIFISNDDDEEMYSAVSLLSGAWPSGCIIRMEHKGHFTLGDMGTREFPELRDVLLG